MKTTAEYFFLASFIGLLLGGFLGGGLINGVLGIA